jgi:hypothetical protein
MLIPWALIVIPIGFILGLLVRRFYFHK